MNSTTVSGAIVPSTSRAIVPAVQASSQQAPAFSTSKNSNSETNQTASNKNTNFSGPNNSRSNAITRNDPRTFKGSTPEIQATLSLPGERVDTDKGFDNFRNCLENYVLKNLKNA